MAKCSKCGQEVADDTVFCPSCGAEIGAHFSQTPDEDKASFDDMKANLNETFDNISEKASEFSKVAGEKVSEFADNFGDKASDFGKKAAAAAGEFGEKATDFAKKTQETINNAPDYSNNFTESDVANNKAMAVLAYLGILVLIPYFAAKNSRFARFHVNQGFIVLILNIIVSVVNSVLGGIKLIHMICVIASILVLALAVLGIVNAVQGRAKELPFVGKFQVIK